MYIAATAIMALRARYSVIEIQDITHTEEAFSYYFNFAIVTVLSGLVAL